MLFRSLWVVSSCFSCLRKLSADHPFLKEMREYKQNLYVVMEVVKAKQEVTLKRASNAISKFSLNLPSLGLQVCYTQTSIERHRDGERQTTHTVLCSVVPSRPGLHRPQTTQSKFSDTGFVLTPPLLSSLVWWCTLVIPAL